MSEEETRVGGASNGNRTILTFLVLAVVCGFLAVSIIACFNTIGANRDAVIEAVEPFVPEDWK
jgi:hypothetical protein